MLRGNHLKGGLGRRELGAERNLARSRAELRDVGADDGDVNLIRCPFEVGTRWDVLLEWVGGSRGLD